MYLNHTVDVMEWARLRLAELRMEKLLLQQENDSLRRQVATLERIINRTIEQNQLEDLPSEEREA